MLLSEDEGPVMEEEDEVDLVEVGHMVEEDLKHQKAMNGLNVKDAIIVMELVI